ncbi:MAG: DUF748 domain-containing protein [Desulfobacteraceae bacterium]|nr:DUF748 domain-containing protein [Desulfobacteraceae bacterium]
MTRKNKAGIIIGSILVFYAVLGFIIIPLTAKYTAPEKIKEIIKRDVEIEKIRFNPFAFSLKIEKFKIYTKDKNNIFAGFDSFYVNINLTSSLFKLSPVISEIYLNSPEFYVEKGIDEKFNFSDLIPQKKEEAEKADEGKNDKKFGFLITDLKIENAGLIFADKPFNTTHKIEKLNLSVPFISGFEKDNETPVHIYLSAAANGADITLDIESRPFLKSLKSGADIKINNVFLPFYYSYLKDFVNFTVSSGNINLELKALFEKADNNNQLEAEAKFDLNDFLINDGKSSKIASLDKISIETNKIYPLKNIYSIKNILIDSPQFEIIQNNQKINILNLVKENNSKKDEKIPNKKDEKKEEPSDFHVGIDEIFIKNGNISFSDYDAPLVLAKDYDEPVKNIISELNLKIDNFSTEKNKSSDFDFKFSLNEKTDFNFNGNFGINPVFANINSEIDKLYFEYANGYIPSNLKILIKNGSADLKSKTDLKIENNELKLSAAGDLHVNEIEIIERETKKDFFKLNNFEINKLKFNLVPMSLDIENILIAGINQQIFKNKNGRFNFQNVFPENIEKDKVEEKTQKSETEKSKLFPINISAITLKDIGADYTDFTLEPYFSTSFIINFANIKNLSSDAFEGADLSLDGKVDNTAVLTANGKLNPLLEDLLVDLKIDLKSLNLTDFTPYSGKFIGKAIQKGQLNLDLDYKIDQRKINAENKVFLDQFELGRTIENKDATNLPVGLAVSLLKNRKGEINLDIPVSGSFDDPKFKVGKVIVDVLKNLVVKAASSPFSLVASIAGGGEEIKYIEFLKGTTEFDPKSVKRLEAVEKILFERPGLNLDIKGYCDTKKDSDALINEKFEVLVNNKKTALGYEKNQNLSEKDYLNILEKIHYDVFNEKFNSELDVINKISEITEKVKSSFKITDEDLRYLASKRAGIVRNFLADSGRVDTSRLFINETRIISPSKVNDISNSRVELDLR